MTRTPDGRARPSWRPTSLDRPPSRAGLLRGLSVAASGLAAVTLVALRVVVDAPVTLPRPTASAAALLGPTAPLAGGVIATTAVVLGTTADRVTHPASLGSIAVGVFGLLALASDAAVLPAVGVIVAAGVVVLAPWRAADTRRRTLPLVCLAGGLALTTTAAAGLGPLVGRTIGVPIVLLGFALTPLLAPDLARADLLAGLVAGLLVFAVGLDAPFVTAAATVTLTGVAGVPVVFVAPATAGLVATASAATADGRWWVVAGVGVLLAAGAPVSIPRALALVVGAALVASVFDPNGGGVDG